MTAIALQRKTEILEQVANGRKLCDIAATYGISQPAISKVLASDKDFIAARETGALARIEAWETEIEGINPETAPVMLARAREMLSHARWRAEREFPATWAPRGTAVQINLGVAVLDQASIGSVSALLDRLSPVSPTQQSGDAAPLLPYSPVDDSNTP